LRCRGAGERGSGGAEGRTQCGIRNTQRVPECGIEIQGPGAGLNAEGGVTAEGQSLREAEGLPDTHLDAGEVRGRK